MTDELISCLMAIRALRVASRTSAVAYRDTGKPLRQIAEELQVEWIVEGSVLYSGSRVRITAHLIEAATDRQLWARTYERDVSEILALQSSVASDIAAEVRVTLTTAERSRIGKTHRVDPEAYDAHLRGRHFWNKRTRDGLKRAADYFRAAIDGDPTYAPAYAGLADTRCSARSATTCFRQARRCLAPGPPRFGRSRSTTASRRPTRPSDT
jgi:hypothetical protein